MSIDAGQSPRRRQLLDQIGVRHELLLPGPEEDAEALEQVNARLEKLEPGECRMEDILMAW